MDRLGQSIVDLCNDVVVEDTIRPCSRLQFILERFNVPDLDQLLRCTRGVLSGQAVLWSKHVHSTLTPDRLDVWIPWSTRNMCRTATFLCVRGFGWPVVHTQHALYRYIVDPPTTIVDVHMYTQPKGVQSVCVYYVSQPSVYLEQVLRKAPPIFQLSYRPESPTTGSAQWDHRMYQLSTSIITEPHHWLRLVREMVRLYLDGGYIPAVDWASYLQHQFLFGPTMDLPSWVVKWNYIVWPARSRFPLMYITSAPPGTFLYLAIQSPGTSGQLTSHDVRPRKHVPLLYYDMCSALHCVQTYLPTPEQYRTLAVPMDVMQISSSNQLLDNTLCFDFFTLSYIPVMEYINMYPDHLVFLSSDFTCASGYTADNLQQQTRFYRTRRNSLANVDRCTYVIPVFVEYTLFVLGSHIHRTLNNTGTGGIYRIVACNCQWPFTCSEAALDAVDFTSTHHGQSGTEKRIHKLQQVIV